MIRGSDGGVSIDIFGDVMIYKNKYTSIYKPQV